MSSWLWLEWMRLVFGFLVRLLLMTARGQGVCRFSEIQLKIKCCCWFYDREMRVKMLPGFWRKVQVARSSWFLVKIQWSEFLGFVMLGSVHDRKRARLLWEIEVNAKTRYKVRVFSWSLLQFLYNRKKKWWNCWFVLVFSLFHNDEYGCVIKIAMLPSAAACCSWQGKRKRKPCCYCLVWDGFVVLSFWQFFRTWPKQFFSINESWSVLLHSSLSCDCHEPLLTEK